MAAGTRGREVETGPYTDQTTPKCPAISPSRRKMLFRCSLELNAVHNLDDAAIAEGVEVAVGAVGVLKPAPSEIGANVG